MNRTETKNLLIKISAYKPAQQLNLLTAPAWQEALTEVSWDDANRAVIELAGEIAFIGLNDVEQRVKHYVTERVNRQEGSLIPPAGLTPAEYCAWLRSSRRRIALGETADDINLVAFAELPEHNIRALLGARQ